ncbi:hypothetical protein HMI54_001707 [Coelomomyces lativittatus]|nr:hypothetical protein HMI54_001707 [Coelomomyces lativittatus]KAJ1510607.1 hypothetical protein HMI56_006256 [Coelomomyces lativittatus]KAJ1513845.1 hypothetical protein HMI55_005175 [Coelomomyces lativittatus]
MQTDNSSLWSSDDILEISAPQYRDYCKGKRNPLHPNYNICHFTPCSSSSFCADVLDPESNEVDGLKAIDRRRSTSSTAVTTSVKCDSPILQSFKNLFPNPKFVVTSSRFWFVTKRTQSTRF